MSDDTNLQAFTGDNPTSVTAQTYTCPMHPEVRRPAPGHCPTCGMNLEPVATRDRSRTALTTGACLFFAVAAFFLWTEHRAHVMGALPYLLLLLCPILHLFMHRRHDRGHGGQDPSARGARP